MEHVNKYFRKLFETTIPYQLKIHLAKTFQLYFVIWQSGTEFNVEIDDLTDKINNKIKIKCLI